MFASARSTVTQPSVPIRGADYPDVWKALEVLEGGLFQF